MVKSFYGKWFKVLMVAAMVFGSIIPSVQAATPELSSGPSNVSIGLLPDFSLSSGEITIQQEGSSKWNYKSYYFNAAAENMPSADLSEFMVDPQSTYFLYLKTRYYDKQNQNKSIVYMDYKVISGTDLIAMDNWAVGDNTRKLVPAESVIGTLNYQLVGTYGSPYTMKEYHAENSTIYTPHPRVVAANQYTEKAESQDEIIGYSLLTEIDLTQGSGDAIVDFTQELQNTITLDLPANVSRFQVTSQPEVYHVFKAQMEGTTASIKQIKANKRPVYLYMDLKEPNGVSAWSTEEWIDLNVAAPLFNDQPLNMSLTDLKVNPDQLTVRVDASQGNYRYSHIADASNLNNRVQSGSAVLKNGNGETVQSWLSLQADRSITLPLTESLKSGDYTLEYTLSFAHQEEPVTASLQFSTQSQDSSEIFGVKVQAEGPNDQALASGKVHVFEKGATMQSSEWWLEEVYSADFITGSGTAHAFIPNAYLIEGSRYDIVVEGTTADGKAVYYHREIEASIDSMDVNFTGSSLTKLNLTTELTSPEGTMGLTFDMSNGLDTYPVILPVTAGASTVYVDSSTGYVTADMMISDNAASYVLEKEIALNDIAELNVMMDDDLVQINTPIGHVNAGISLNQMEPKPEAYVSRGLPYVNVHYLTSKNSFYYVYEHHYFDVDADVSQEIGTSFTGFGDSYLFPEKNQIGFKVYYEDSFSNSLRGVFAGAPELEGNTNSFQSLKADGSKHTINPVMTSQGTEYVELEQESGLTSAPSLLEDTILTYQIYDDSDHKVGDVISVGGEFPNMITTDLPDASGHYSLKLETQTFPVDDAALQATVEFEVPEQTVGNKDITVQIPAGYKQNSNWFYIDFYAYEIVDGHEEYRAQQFVQSDSGKVTIPLSFIKPNWNYRLNGSISLDGATVYYIDQQLTGTQLNELQSIAVPEQLVKVAFQHSEYADKIKDGWLYINRREENRSYGFGIGNHVKQAIVRPGAYDFKLAGSDGETTAYTIIKKLDITEDTTLTFANELNSLVKVELKNGTAVIPFKSVWSHSEDGGFYSSVGTRFYGNDLRVYKALYTVPGPQSWSFETEKINPNETPWVYNWSTEKLDLQQDTVLNFTQAVDVKEIHDIGTYTHPDGYQGLFAHTVLKSGDLYLSGVGVKRESFKSLAVSESQPDWLVKQDYEGYFNTRYTVKPLVKITNSSNEEVFRGYSGEYGLGYISLKGVELESGEYQMNYSLATGPREKIEMSNSFAIDSHLAITAPHNGAVIKDSTFAVTGNAPANAEVELLVKQGETVLQTLSVSANAEGHFQSNVSLANDGEYSLSVRLKSDTEVESGEVAITIDRTPPSITAFDVAQQADGIALSWTAANGAHHYDVYAAEKGSALQLVQSSLTASTYKYTSIQPGKTYQFKITAYDAAGNKVESAVKEITTSAFGAVKVSTELQLTNYGLAKIGDKMIIALEGSYEEGFTGQATVTYKQAGETESSIVDLAYVQAAKAYKGEFVLAEGISELISVTAHIAKADGETKTNEVTQAINKRIGASVSGKVTRGGMELAEKVGIQLASPVRTINIESASDGTFKAEGIPAGEYKANVVYKNEVFRALAAVGAENGKTAVLAQQLDIPALVSAKFTIVEQDGEAYLPINKELYVTIKGADKGNQNFVVTGYNKGGLFTSWNGQQTIGRMPAGNYQVNVQGGGIYTDTELTLAVGPDNDPNAPIQIVVSKQDVETTDVTITFVDTNDEVITDLDSISYFYLSSWKIMNQFNYTLGQYSAWEQPITDGKLVLGDVVMSDDYQFYLYVEGYRNLNAQAVTLTEGATELKVELDPGVTVKGKLTVTEGNVPGADIYAYTEGFSSMAYTKANPDGTFELKGLESGKNIFYSVKAFGYLPIENVQAEVTGTPAEVDLGEIALQSENYIQGKVFDKDGKTPLKHVYVYANANNEYKGFARTDDQGYFKVRGLAEGEYKLTFSKYGYPTVEGTYDATPEEKTIILQEQGEGSFSGEGNQLAVSQATVVPGKSLDYRLSYQNNGSDDLQNVPLEVALPANADLIAESVMLDGQPQAVTVADSKFTVTVPEVAAGAGGTLTFQLKVKEDAEGSVISNAKINNGNQVLSATTSVLFVTLNAPEQTASQKIKVYGNAKPGSIVEIVDGTVSLAQVRVDKRWWFAEITLPMANNTDESQHSLMAKVTDGSQQFISEAVDVLYSPDIPQLEDVTVSAGWNGDVKLNPYTGVATFAIVEKTPMNSTIEFKEAVDSAYLTFLGEKSELTSQDGGTTFTGGVPAGWSSYGEQLLELTFKKGDIEITLPLMEIIVLIDPSGYVFEGSMDNRLSGVTATVFEKENNVWTPWNAAFFGQVNPQTTDADGRYGWDVVEGDWRVEFTKPGFDSYSSRIVVVPPAETQLNVPMVRSTDPSIVFVTPDGGSQNVEIANSLTIEFDRLMNQSNMASQIRLVKVSGESETDVPFTITYENMIGYKEDTSKAAGGLEDSNGQSGWFIPDPEKKLSRSIVIDPTANLDYSASYKLVIGDELVDYAGKQLLQGNEYSFTTKSTPVTPGDGGVPYIPPAPETGTVPGPATETGEPTDTEVVYTADTLPALTDGKLVLQVEDEKSTKVVIPASIAEQSETQSVVVETKAGKVELPADVLKQLVQLVSSEELDGSAISIQVEAKDAAEAGASIRALANETTAVKAAGQFVDLSLSLVKKDGTEVKLTQFNEPVTLRLKVSGTADKGLVGVYYIDNSGKVSFVGGNIVGDEIVVQLEHFSQYAVLEFKKTFTDLPDKHWAARTVVELSAKHIVSGVNDKQFAPGKNVTRAEFVTMLVNALQLKASKPSGFTDVAETSWYADEVAAAVEHGIVKGVNATSFAPNKSITREEMAVMIVNAMKLLEKEMTVADPIEEFADIQLASEWAKDSIEMAAKAGIIKGKGSNEFDPKALATRVEAAQMIYNLIKE